MNSPGADDDSNLATKFTHLEREFELEKFSRYKSARRVVKPKAGIDRR